MQHDSAVAPKMFQGNDSKEKHSENASLERFETLRLTSVSMAIERQPIFCSLSVQQVMFVDLNDVGSNALDTNSTSTKK